METTEPALESFSHASADGELSDEDRRRAVESLERGRILYFPRLGFVLESAEQRLLSLELTAARAKNISFDPERGHLSGAAGDARTMSDLREMLRRYGGFARGLVEGAIPAYRAALATARTSFRPVEISDRPTRIKADDRLLHVDAFPAHPTRGARILRVFSNVDPLGRERVWRIGGPFEAFAARFLPRVKRSIPGLARCLELLGITAGRRSDYDHVMLRLHDLAKHDERYQRGESRVELAFASGSTWMLFSDQVPHAALSGQYVLEQTFHLPVEAQLHPETAPIRVIERLRRT